MKHGAVSLVFFFTAPSLGHLLTFNCWTNLASKVTKQAKDDRPWIVDMDWTYRDKNKQRVDLKECFNLAEAVH